MLSFKKAALLRVIGFIFLILTDNLLAVSRPQSIMHTYEAHRSCRIGKFISHFTHGRLSSALIYLPFRFLPSFFFADRSRERMALLKYDNGLINSRR